MPMASSPFALGCLLSRRLVETGVPFVEVVSDGWDTHFDNFDTAKRLAATVDQPFAALMADLASRGMLDKTLVVWMGEFGRTPHINARNGRDHFPTAFNVVLAGGGVRGGQVIGKTDAGGTEVTDRPVRVPDLFASFCHSLGHRSGQREHEQHRPADQAGRRRPGRQRAVRLSSLWATPQSRRAVGRARFAHPSAANSS